MLHASMRREDVEHMNEGLVICHTDVATFQSIESINSTKKIHQDNFNLGFPIPDGTY